MYIPVFNKKMWPSIVIDEHHAIFSADGLTVKCLRCLGKGRSKGRIKMRYAYGTSAWDDHCKSDSHIDAVKDYEAMKANKKDTHKQGQSSMLAFFNVKEKKKSTDYTNTVTTNTVTNVDEAEEVHNVDKDDEKKNRTSTR